MKVMLLQDVYKLGRAGDVKKVADGYGRNYLIPQGLAVLATPDALKMTERIRVVADKQRQELNKELSGVAEQIEGMVLTFPARASETGRLYGSVTTHMIAEAIQEKAGVEVSRRQVDVQPLRELGEYTVAVRLTVDLIPEVKVIVYREGEAVPTLTDEAETVAEVEVEEVIVAEAEEEAEAAVAAEPAAAELDEAADAADLADEVEAEA